MLRKQEHVLTNVQKTIKKIKSRDALFYTSFYNKIIVCFCISSVISPQGRASQCRIFCTNVNN